MAAERVQKILAQAGISSRRKAEELISEGLVTINGKIAQLGDKADLSQDAVKVKGKLLRGTEPPAYFAFYKPRGVISMLADPEGRPTIADFLPKVRTRVFPIGRLDFNSEGLILLTNDGELAEKIQKNDQIARVYHIKVKGHPTPEMLARLGRGGKVDDKLVKLHSARIAQELQNKAVIEVVALGSGGSDHKSLLESKGFLVEKVTRVALGQITLHGLKPGETKPLEKSQLIALIEHPELGMRLIEESLEKAKPAEEARAYRRARAEAKQESDDKRERVKVRVAATLSDERPARRTTVRGAGISRSAIPPREEREERGGKRSERGFGRDGSRSGRDAKPFGRETSRSERSTRSFGRDSERGERAPKPYGRGADRDSRPTFGRGGERGERSFGRADDRSARGMAPIPRDALGDDRKPSKPYGRGGERSDRGPKPFGRGGERAERGPKPFGRGGKRADRTESSDRPRPGAGFGAKRTGGFGKPAFEPREGGTRGGRRSMNDGDRGGTSTGIQPRAPRGAKPASNRGLAGKGPTGGSSKGPKGRKFKDVF